MNACFQSCFENKEWSENLNEWKNTKQQLKANSILTARRFHSLFHSPWNWCPEHTCFNQNDQADMLVTQAGRVLFIVPLRYLFAIGFQYIMDEHQYLAFDVSLPPLNNLSCSPKQLDSDNWQMNWTSNFQVHTKRDCHTLWCKKKIAFQQKWTFSVYKNKKKTKNWKRTNGKLPYAKQLHLEKGLKGKKVPCYNSTLSTYPKSMQQE